MVSTFKRTTPGADDTSVMQANARHDLRHPLATMYLVGSTAHAFGTEMGGETLNRCREEMDAELKLFCTLVRRHRVAVDLSDLSRAVAAFVRDPASSARGVAVQDACRGVLAQLSLSDAPRDKRTDEGALKSGAGGLHAFEA